MRVHYEFELTGICPADQRADIYSCEVVAARTISVEVILEAAKTATLIPRYQEDITRELHRILAAEVRTVGWHSGVKTTVIEGPVS